MLSKKVKLFFTEIDNELKNNTGEARRQCNISFNNTMVFMHLCFNENEEHRYARQHFKQFIFNSTIKFSNYWYDNKSIINLIEDLEEDLLDMDSYPLECKKNIEKYLDAFFLKGCNDLDNDMILFIYVFRKIIKLYFHDDKKPFEDEKFIEELNNITKKYNGIYNKNIDIGKYTDFLRYDFIKKSNLDDKKNFLNIIFRDDKKNKKISKPTNKNNNVKITSKELKKLTVKGLKELCKKKGIKTNSKFRRDDYERVLLKK